MCVCLRVYDILLLECVCVHHVLAVPAEARRGCRTPCHRSCRHLQPALFPAQLSFPVFVVLRRIKVQVSTGFSVEVEVYVFRLNLL